MRKQDLDLITAREIDKVVCDWSMNNGIVLTEDQLNELVDNICELVEIDVKEALQ